jgi:hypothetical protein
VIGQVRRWVAAGNGVVITVESSSAGCRRRGQAMPAYDPRSLKSIG